MKMEQYNLPKLKKFEQPKIEEVYWDKREFEFSKNPSVLNKKPKEIRWDPKSLEFKVIN